MTASRLHENPMALSIGKIEGIHTLVVGVTGIALAAFIAWGFLKLEQQQHDAEEDALALRDVQRLEESVRQWLLLNDLIYGSGETYLIEGASSLGMLAREIVIELDSSSLAAARTEALRALTMLLEANESRLERAAHISVHTEVAEATALLTAWDEHSRQAVGLVNTLRGDMTHAAEARSRVVAANRGRLTGLASLAAAFYVALVLAMWRWVRRIIVGPLRALTGAAERALRAAEHDSQRENLNTIIESGSQLLGVINDILDYSKLDAGHMELEEQPFDLHQVLQAVADLFAPLAQERQLTLLLLPACHTPRHLRGDSLRVRQVLLNLVGNALKFTDSGHILVRCRPTDEAGSMATIRFEVEDTGIGFAPERRDELFEPFRQADGTSTRKTAGTGLGLSICRRFVEMMGGAIGAEAEPGRGATFWCTMRFAIEKPAARPSPLARRVTLRAEQPELRGYLQALLDHWGCILVDDKPGEAPDVIIAEDGLQPGDATRSARAVVLAAGFAPESLPIDCARLSKAFTPDFLYELLVADVDQPGYPRDRPIDGSSSSKTREATSARFDLRVLVVEDNQVNQMVVRKMLAKMGCAVMLADDGAAALEAIEHHAYDLVLMDWHMPRMDGLETTQRVRRREQQQGGGHLPIVALTANAMAGDEAACRAAGMDGYLSKPLSMKALEDLLAQFGTVRPL